MTLELLSLLTIGKDWVDLNTFKGHGFPVGAVRLLQHTHTHTQTTFPMEARELRRDMTNECDQMLMLIINNTSFNWSLLYFVQNYGGSSWFNKSSVWLLMLTKDMSYEADYPTVEASNFSLWSSLLPPSSSLPFSLCVLTKSHTTSTDMWLCRTSLNMPKPNSLTILRN